MAIMRPKTPTPRPALTAATAMIPLGEESSWKTWKFGNRDWQDEGWRLYDITPEHRFLANWIGDSVSHARLFVADVDETGEELSETEDEEVSQLAAIPLGTGSQRDDNLRLAGIDLAVAGECWIVGEGAAIEDTDKWFVATGSAIKRVGGDISVRRPMAHSGGILKLRDGVDILTRCWCPHPNDLDQADSPTRSAIVPLREIELLTKREFAELDSRLTGAGVMFLPEGIDFPRGPDDPEGMAGFMAYMQRAAAASMKDQSRASAMVPIMASIPDQFVEHMDKLKPVTFWSELSAEIGAMKERAIVRMSSSFEIPSEILLGIGKTNHWSAWAISEEGIKRIRRYLTPIADALTRGFLRSRLIAMGRQPEKYAYAFDLSGLAARPNRLADALQLHDRSLISDIEAVRAGAFSEEQMPTITERAQQLLMKLVLASPDLILDPTVQVALGLPRATRPTGGGSGPEPIRGGGEVGGPPAIGSGPSALEASAKLTVLRALELAGGRLTTPAERRGRWSGVPRHELHTRVGPIPQPQIDRALVGAWSHVDAMAEDLQCDPLSLRELLSGYVSELLARGMAHHDDLLRAALVHRRAS